MARAVKGIGEAATSYSSSIKEITSKLACSNRVELEALERTFASDTRKGVISAIKAAHKRLDKEEKERARVQALYGFQNDIASKKGAKLICGLDEVGRGSVAGPLAVGAVILPDEPIILGLNDSKQITPENRVKIAAEIKEFATAWTVQYVDAAYIDSHGMTASLKLAFSKAVAVLEKQGFNPDLLLLDGNPLHFDKREYNIVHGDARAASIAAASIVAKVERDALMVELSKEYPEYHLDSCKGYASAAHIQAIKELGLTPIHRESFCTAFTQKTLFDD